MDWHSFSHWAYCSAWHRLGAGDALPLGTTRSRAWRVVAAEDSKPSRRRGFTLLEVMIVVAIVALLAAIALPLYTQQLRRSARAEAQSFLTSAASSQQQFLIDRRSYAASLAALNATPPADLTGKYTFTVAAADGPPPTFTLTATATGDQANDACPTLMLDSSGSKSPDTCW
ncbi:MAG TPA: type IV pilin protein [Casimicrobiaceae bacterium]